MQLLQCIATSGSQFIQSLWTVYRNAMHMTLRRLCVPSDIWHVHDKPCTEHCSNFITSHAGSLIASFDLLTFLRSMRHKAQQRFNYLASELRAIWCRRRMYIRRRRLDTRRQMLRQKDVVTDSRFNESRDIASNVASFSHRRRSDAKSRGRIEGQSYAEAVNVLCFI